MNTLKNLCFCLLMMIMGTQFAAAQDKAEIKFETLSHDFGKFSEEDPVVSYTFKFKNIGGAPLVIHQAVASCGCTVPKYTQDPIMPGSEGAITVTYNGTGKYPGTFKKTITVRTNGSEELIRLTISGNMTEKEKK